jgi:predicted dehydrogenase
MTTVRKKYAIVGVGGRANCFYQALLGDLKDLGEVCAFCDVNQARMNHANDIIVEDFGGKPVNTYKAEKFDEMIKTEKPDEVIVATIDRLHHKYIVRAMELGCDVISEKPMTVDVEKCKEILDAIKRTGKKLRVTFNYRYSPCSTRTKEVLMSGAIGDIISVNLEWMLDKKHGADYFRRWHRDKRNSGGLMVHKATHHFDLVNWWIDSTPETVFAMGDLMFYGRENAENRGEPRNYFRSTNNPNAKDDPFALDLSSKIGLRKMFLEGEKEDGYIRDQNVFGDGISIEDTMAVMVRYKNKVKMSYSLNAFLPWEGYNLSINGTKGRLESTVASRSYINTGGAIGDEGVSKFEKLTVLPMFGKPYDIKIEQLPGGHGGGDPLMLNDLFGEVKEDKFKRAASHVDGAMSILTGIAANKSFATGLPVKVDSLIDFI